MEKSFQEILNEHMTERASETPVEPTRAAPTVDWAEFTFNLIHFPRENAAKSAFSISSYKTGQTQVASEKVDVQSSETIDKPPPAPRPETVIPLTDLNTDQRTQAEILIQLGGKEIVHGLSKKRLKTAHRRLARQLHPDTARLVSTEAFLRLQKAVKALETALRHSESETKKAA